MVLDCLSSLLPQSLNTFVNPQPLGLVFVFFAHCYDSNGTSISTFLHCLHSWSIQHTLRAPINRTILFINMNVHIIIIIVIFPVVDGP